MKSGNGFDTGRARSKNYLQPHLAKEDKYVPEGYISLTELFVVSPKVASLYGVKTAEKHRKQTFQNVLKLYNDYGADKFDEFWNANVYEITGLGLNEFAKYEQLKPICLLIKAFAKRKRCKNGTTLYISFGIKMTTLAAFTKERDRCEKEGIEFDEKKFATKRIRQVAKSAITHGEIPINLSTNRTITMIRNATVRRFYDWCSIQDISVREGIFKAFSLVMEQNPIEGLRSIEDYNSNTTLEDYLLKTKVPDIKTTYEIQDIDNTLVKQVEDIVVRYNKDPKNQTGFPLEVSDYIIKAIKLMNNKMPVEYSAPELYEEYVKSDISSEVV